MNHPFIFPCQVLQSHARVCRAGRRQDFAGDICLREDEAGIEPRGGGSRAEHTGNLGGRNQRGNIVCDGVFDAGIAGTRDFAGGEHVPKREAMAQQQRCLFLDGCGLLLVERESENRPEAILRVRIIKRLLA